MYNTKILADSISLAGHRLTTFQLTYPRFVHDEFMTHRALSRNTSSSRAVPIAKVIEQVQNDPVIPVEWGQNQKGMVAERQLTATDALDAESVWLDARLDAIRNARKLAEYGVHKQLVNRILMPWQWITTIASGTDEGWQNFFALRTATDAQPEIRRIAVMMASLYYDGEPPVELMKGEWHTPFVLSRPGSIRDAKISSARCAAVSYLRQDDERTDDEWVAMCEEKLVKPNHMSPLEHAAMCTGDNHRYGNFHGWEQLRKTYINEVRTFSKDDWAKIAEGNRLSMHTMEGKSNA